MILYIAGCFAGSSAAMTAVAFWLRDRTCSIISMTLAVPAVVLSVWQDFL